MYSLYWLGVRITPKDVDELPLPAIEMRKATKSTKSTASTKYNGGPQGLFEVPNCKKSLWMCRSWKKKKGIGLVCRCRREKRSKVSDASVRCDIKGHRSVDRRPATF